MQHLGKKKGKGKGEERREEFDIVEQANLIALEKREKTQRETDKKQVRKKRHRATGPTRPCTFASVIQLSLITVIKSAARYAKIYGCCLINVAK